MDEGAFRANGAIVAAAASYIIGKFRQAAVVSSPNIGRDAHSWPERGSIGEIFFERISLDLSHSSDSGWENHPHIWRWSYIEAEGLSR